MRIKNIMLPSIHTISSDRSIRFASELMKELNTDAFIVTDYGETLGMITALDVLSSHPNRIVADAMNPDPIRISPDQFAWEALALMDNNNIGHLLVIEDEQSIGIVNKHSVHIHLSELMDPLTGMYRAPYIQQIGEQLLRQQEPFHLLFIDLNDFGEINKLHGHPVGDDIIIHFSNRLRTLANDQDFVCRYAGDEFVIITLANENYALQLANGLSRPETVQGVTVSASVGMINGYADPEFFSLTFREHISAASLQSTSLKQNAAIMY